MKTLHLSFSNAPAMSRTAPIPLEVIPLGAKGCNGIHLATIGSTTEISLLPGQYSLRARLPNGEILQQLVDIPTGAEQDISAEFILDGATAPDQDTAWAYILQEPSRIAKSAGNKPGRIIRDTPSSPGRYKPLSGGLPWSLDTSIFPRSYFPGPETSTRILQLAHKNGTPHWAEVSGVLQEQSKPCADQTARLLLNIDAATHTQPYYLELSARVSGKCLLTRIPPSGRQPTTLLVYSDTDNNDWDIKLNTWHDGAMSLLAYLTRGDFDSARVLGDAFMEEAVSLMAGKMNDYTNALIGGYFLWKAADWSDDEKRVGEVRVGDLRQWLENLSEHFPTQSDGAIIYGSYLLDRGDGAAAKQQYLAAAQRGMPCFAMGLHAMANGLRYVQSVEGVGHDAQVDAALTMADSWLTQLVKDSPLASFHLATELEEAAPTLENGDFPKLFPTSSFSP